MMVDVLLPDGGLLSGGRDGFVGGFEIEMVELVKDFI